MSIDTGFPNCNAFEGFRELPLPSLKTLWEAKTREDWELEYSIYTTIQESRLQTLGTLIESLQQNDNPAMSQQLDHWNGSADNLGSLLNIVAGME